MKLYSVKEAAEKTRIPLTTLRYYMRAGKSPFAFRRLPSGRIVITEEELKNGLDALAEYIARKRA